MPLHSQTTPPASEQSSTEVIKRSVSASTISKKLADARARRLLTIFNHSSSALYVDLGTSVSISDFAVRIPPYSYYECPFPVSLEIRGVWEEAKGKALIREFI